MSTLRENLTPISGTSGVVTNGLVKSEEARFGSGKDFGFCENSDQCFPLADSPSTIGTIGDLLSAAAHRLSADEELVKKTSGNEETLGTSSDQRLIDIKSEPVQSSDIHHFGASPNTISKRRFAEFLKSFLVLCDICDDRNTERVIKLNRHERIVAAIILKKSFGFGVRTKKIFPTKIPEQSCGRCFAKIILVYNRHRDRYTQRKIKREPGQVMAEHSHGYHCQCLTCQNQYGALPVLLKGIEEQNKIQSSQFQPGHNLGMTESHNLVNLQQPGDVYPGHSQEQAQFQQYPGKAFQPQLQAHFQPSQTSTQEYGHFEMHESQTEVNFQSASKTELYLGQTPDDFTMQRPNESPFDVNFQDQSQYYGSEASSSTQNLADPSGTCTPEQHLPTLLQELEEKCQTDLTSQPSTSSGISGHSHSPDDKQSKKIMTCVHCDKNFTHKGDFNKHLRKHTKERPYKCSFCDKTFSHTSNLHRHERIHSGDRPFKCPHCDKCFNRKDKLESHKNSKFCKNRRNWK